MTVSSGCLVTTRSTTCVFHSGKACAEYGACRSILIAKCSRCQVSFCLYLMVFVDAAYILCICNGFVVSKWRKELWHSIGYGWHNSLLGHNLLFCAQLYDYSAQDIISSSVNRLVNNLRLS